MRFPKATIRCAVTASGFLLVLFATCTAQHGNLGVAETNPGIADLVSDESNHFKYAPNTLQTAQIIGVESDIEKLYSLTSAREAGAAAGPSLEELLLRQQIAEAIIAASLDLDSVAAEVNYERDQTVELRSIFRYKRDRAIGSTNLAVLAAGTGLGIVSGLLQFSHTTSGAGNMIGFAGGGLSTLFSLRSYRQVHGGERPAWVLPNMLAAVLGQPEEEHSHYPADIWAYLNSVPSGATSSRREQLLAGWAAAGRIGPQGSSQSKRRIALLTTTDAANKDLNIELMNERAAMLADVVDQVSLMKHDLADLLRGLRSR
jgi:hypothetical protein